VVRATRRDRGFTLVELLIAMALCLVGLLGLIALQIIALRGNMLSRNFSEAIGIAQGRLETAQRTPIANLGSLVEVGSGTCTVYPSSTPPNCTNAPTTLVSPDGNTNTQVYQRCTATATNADGSTTVQVSVCWTDASNNNHAITLYDKRSP
jgi:prepilin-type N-terminal cleavage/methylation domain-containing protein